MFRWILVAIGLEFLGDAAIIPPPWANPKVNPCAKRPGGWQLLYWPPDRKCYKIFRLGYPCPDDMELSPTTHQNSQYTAECLCPPGTAQSATDGHCYKLFTQGPCNETDGHYFAPDSAYKTSPNGSKRRWGVCKSPKNCPTPQVFWPSTEQCYQLHTKGPCKLGELITKNDTVRCGCDDNMKKYKHTDGQCYEPYKKGPCKESGQLFIPSIGCDCSANLPHFHPETGQCYEIDTVGPCDKGEIFRDGKCECKSGYIRYGDAIGCYRPYTQGPCPTDHILTDTAKCIRQPCPRGHLLHPKSSQCFRIGTEGPCGAGRVIAFDFNTRPSIDGVSYNAICRYNGDTHRNGCPNGTIIYEGLCRRLYERGPCANGAWLAPRPQTTQGVCECMPGFTKIVRLFFGTTIEDCVSPTVLLADYLNRNFSINF